MFAGECHEGPQFRRSTFCTSGGCVEVAELDDGRVAVRDSREPDRRPQVYSAAEWRDFVAGVKDGQFDV